MRRLQSFVRGAGLGAAALAASASPPLFTARIDITTEADFVTCVAAGDLMGNGRTDFVSGSGSDRTLRWYEHIGGEFPNFTIHPIHVPTEDEVPRHLAVADVDGDGRLDILAAWSTFHFIRWYENNGQSPPSFAAHDVFANTSQIHGMAVADFTGDGRVDIATCDSSRILLHTRIGGGDVWTAIQIAASGSTSLFAADIDGDGRIDLTTGMTSGSVAWLRNLGGSPPLFELHTVFSGAGTVRAVHAADVDGDGRLDILSASETQHAVRLHRSDGANPPNWSTQTVIEGAEGVKAVWAADLNKDGRLDIISGARTEHTLRWHENLGGEPPEFQTHIVSRDTQWVEAVLAADVDGDGCLDIVSASARDDSVRWHRNDLERPGRVVFEKRVIDSGIQLSHDAVVADLTGDGRPDIIATTYFNTSVRWFENLGGNEPQFIRRSIIEGGGFFYSVWPADINGNGWTDLLIGNTTSPHVWWRQNDGASPPAFLSRVIARYGRVLNTTPL